VTRADTSVASRPAASSMQARAAANAFASSIAIQWWCRMCASTSVGTNVATVA